jgi:hypothetical protein
MKFKVGDIVHKKMTQEVGCVVRVTDTKEGKVAYVVSVILDQRWGVKEKEALWIESQVTRTATERFRSESVRADPSCVDTQLSLRE